MTGTGATITDATNQQKVAILNDLASLPPARRMPSTSLETESKAIGQRLGLAWGVVRDVAHAPGWPNPDSMGRAADTIQANVERSGTAGRPRPGLDPVPRPAPPAARDRPLHLIGGSVENVDTLQALIDAAAKSDVAGTRKLGERLEEIAGQIRTRVGDESKAAMIKAAREKEKAERDAEVAQLKARLAELQGVKPAKPKKKSSTPPAESETAKARAWATEQGIRVGTVGRVPADVLEAYRKVAGS